MIKSGLLNEVITTNGEFASLIVNHLKDNELFNLMTSDLLFFTKHCLPPLEKHPETIALYLVENGIAIVHIKNPSAKVVTAAVLYIDNFYDHDNYYYDDEDFWDD